MSLPTKKRQRIIKEFEAKLPKFLEASKNISNGYVKSLAYEIFMESLITKEAPKSMYGAYERKPSPTKYSTLYLQECTLLMLRFPDIAEKLNLSLMDLLHMEPSMITDIEDQMVQLYSRKKNLKPQAGIKDNDYAAELLRHQRKKRRK